MSLMLGNSLLAASLLLGQPASGPTAPIEGEKIIQVQNVQGQPMIQPPQPTRPILGFFRSGSSSSGGGTTYTEERPIWNKLTGWFRRDNNNQDQQQFQQQPIRGGAIRETAPPPVLNNPKPAPNDFYRRMPSPTSKANSMTEPVAKEGTPGKDLQQTAFVAPPKVKSPIRADLANFIGRDERFEWVTGQLEMENGNFVLYYATPETVDKYHGRVVLLPEKADLKQFRSGELISVRGNLTQRQTMQGIVPIYHVTMASRIERPKQ